MTDRYENIRRALAMSPTPGPWEIKDGRTDTVENAQGYPVCTVHWHPDERYGHGTRAAYIAACDPDTIRALLEERDALAATLAATEAARDGYRDDAHQLHAALVRMVAQYESEFDHEDAYKFRPEWLREALARTNALQEGGEGWEIEPETLDAATGAGQAEIEALRRVTKLWLWKNFVDGKPEYWAFDNPFPVHLDCCDPQTLGEPCGYAIFKPSRAGRSDVTEEQVLERIKRKGGSDNE